MRIARILALVAALALVGAACGGDEPTAGGTTTPPPAETTSPPGTESPPASTVTLSMTDNVFSPVDVTIASGGTLEMVNDGATIHNVTIEGTDFDKDINAGETESESVEVAPGDYRMICKFHVSVGMEGTITVTG